MDRQPARRLSLRQVPPWHLAMLGALMAAQVACAVFASVSSSDTSRDIFFAQQIATGARFPLTGPAINGMLHLGPLWYYILAIPLLLVSNASAVTGGMALLSATQFPLAYALGRQVRNAQEGLLFAACLAMPGWVITSFGSLTHPIIAIPSVLLGTLAAMAYRDRPTSMRAAGVGVSLALMCTAHPTLVLIGALLLVWCGKRVPDGKRLIVHLGIVLVVVALPLLPMLYEQWATGFADIEKTSAYTRSEWSVPSPLAAIELVYAMLVYGPKFVTRYWLELSSSATAAMFAVHAGLLALAAIGLVARAIADLALRRLILSVLAILVVHATFLCAVRASMPPWMVYILGLPIAALLALGLGWFRRFAAWRIVITGLLVFTTLWTFCIYAKLMSGATEFRNIRPSPGNQGFMDVRDYEDSVETLRFARVTFRELFSLGHMLCEPVTLFGHLAQQVDYTYAVSAADACGTTANVQFGGMPHTGRVAWVGLHASAWYAIAMAPAQWSGVLGLSHPDQVWNSPVPLAPVVPTFSNFPRTLARVDASFIVEGEAPADRAVLVSHRAHRTLPFEVVRARADGVDVTAAYADPTVSLYVIPARAAGAAVRWEIEIKANRDYVDVLAIAPGEARR